ncbi:MAG: nitroreductase/quinone reductase family protein [Polyangiales bacterium]
MAEPSGSFEKPSAIERGFGAALGWLLKRGIGPSHMRLLEVRGRKSGKLFSLPVDLLVKDGKLYLVGPRGRTQWARNAESAGAVVLRRGHQALEYRVRALTDSEKPPILKGYLDSFKSEVQRFFPVPAGSPVEQFAPLVARYPAFELTPVG